MICVRFYESNGEMAKMPEYRLSAKADYKTGNALCWQQPCYGIEVLPSQDDESGIENDAEVLLQAQVCGHNVVRALMRQIRRDDWLIRNGAARDWIVRRLEYAKMVLYSVLDRAFAKTA